MTTFAVKRMGWAVLAGCGAGVALLLSGCSGLATPNAVPEPVTIVGAKLHGMVHGGQQPISGSRIYLFAAGTRRYNGLQSSYLLNSTVVTGADGSFSFPSSAYSCKAGQQLWIVALGGSPGGVAGQNSNAANMAALGDCASVNDNTYVNLNEVTTVGSVFALAPFMTGFDTINTSPTNVAGLARAFASVNKLVNIATGTAVGSALPAGATGPSAEINTLADAVATCINSSGGSYGDGSACTTLFSLAPPDGARITINALLTIAQNPTQNVAAIYNTVHVGAPFSPRLTTAPADWTMAVTYALPGLSAPQSTTIDASGNVWIANAGNNTVTLLAQSGAVAGTFSGNGLNAPSDVAIDTSGNGWVTNGGGNSVSVFTGAGAAVSGSPFLGLSNPSAIAFDALGDAWITNAGNNSVSELSSTGALLQQITTNVTAPAAVAINPK